MKTHLKLIILLTIFNSVSSYCQSRYSKIFDNYGQWENFWEPLEINNGKFTLVGTTQNFLVSDSTRFEMTFLSSLLKDSLIKNTYLLAKDSFNCGYSTFVEHKNKKYLFSYELDLREKTYRNISYFQNEMSTNFDSVISRILLPIDSTFIATCWIKDSSTIYGFGRKSKYSLSSKTGLYFIDLNNKIYNYYPIEGVGGYIFNAVKTKDGNFIVGGSKDFGTFSIDSTFGWLAKVDTSGKIIWEKTFDRKSALPNLGIWVTKTSNESIYLAGGNLANFGNIPWYYSVYGDTSFCFIAKINENNGEIEWQKKFLYTINKINGLSNDLGRSIINKNNHLYALVDHKASERENPNDLSQYVMLAKFDLQGNLIWKRLFSNWYLSNRAYSLTSIDDGFLICGDSKDSTHAKGDSDAWLIKTDTNGCIIPGCNAKDGIAQIINPEKVFTVYPNPAQNEVNVELNFDKLNYQYIESLAIYNMQGQVLKTVSKSTKINTEDLANGNYLLIITTNKQQMAGKKFVVER